MHTRKHRLLLRTPTSTLETVFIALLLWVLALAVLVVLLCLLGLIPVSASASTSALSATPSADFSRALDRADRNQLIFTDTMEQIQFLLETTTAFQIALWERHQLGLITQQQWDDSAYLARELVSSTFPVIQSAYSYLALDARGAEDPATDSGLLRRMRRVDLLFQQYMQNALSLTPTKEIPPWLQHQMNQRP